MARAAAEVLKQTQLAKEALEQLKDKVPGFVQHFTLASTSISDIWYNSVSQVMWLKFRKVKEYPKYRFEGVPQALVVEMVNATSAGGVYHSKIKGNYYSSSIDGPEGDDSIREQVFNLL